MSDRSLPGHVGAREDQLSSDQQEHRPPHLIRWPIDDDCVRSFEAVEML
jgi:hypothetical protein